MAIDLARAPQADRVAMSCATRLTIRAATPERGIVPRAPVLSAMALFAVVAMAALVATTAAQGAVSPAVYRVGRLCGSAKPGYFGCLGLRLIPRQQASEQDTSASQPNGPIAQPPASVFEPAGSASRPIASAADPAGSNPGDEGRGALKKREYKEPWPGSLAPAEIADAYGLAGLPAPAKTQTLALVDAYNDPTIEHDLEVFDEKYALPACTVANRCFTKLEMQSKGKAPPNEAGWAQEISTDVELAHGLCPGCKILLVEAYSNENENLEAAERKAEELGATEISNSWGGPEVGITTEEDQSDAFNDPGTVIAAAAGDEGYLDWGAEEESERGYPDYPASSPHVVAVGGTRLESTAGGTWKGETIWNGDGAGGGGCSTVLEAQPWQQSLPDWPAVGCGSHRAVADVSADADPYTGVSIYDSTPVVEYGVEYRGWTMIGGTSVATPIIASTYALAGGAGTEPDGEAVKYPAKTLYENLAFDPSTLHEVTVGSNGACSKGFDEITGLSECSLTEEGESCSQQAICVARHGYDGPSGVGTPDGIAAFQPLSHADEQKAAEKKAAEKAEEEQREREAQERKEREARETTERKTAEQKAAERVEAERVQAERVQAERVEAERTQAERVEGERREREAQEGKEREARETTERKTAAEELSRNKSATTGATQGPSGTGSSGTQSASPGAAAQAVPVLSDLMLTRDAIAALGAGYQTSSRISFVFTSSLAAHVRVKIAKEAIAHGHKHWQALPYTQTIAAAKGHDSARLSARVSLRTGSYRLTLTPAGGTSRSLMFQVR